MKRQAAAEPSLATRRRAASAEPLRLPRSLPRGHHALSRDVVLLSQRSRLLEGMVLAVAAKGYAATTVADVCARAGVSRATFYEQFSDKENCFLAAYEAGARVHFDHVNAAGRAPDDVFDRLHAALRAYLEVLAGEPAYARTFLIEIVAAGPHAVERRLHMQQRYVELLREWHDNVRRAAPDVEPVPDELLVAAVGAINELVVDHVRRGATARLVDLEPLVFRAVVGLLGVQPASMLRPVPI